MKYLLLTGAKNTGKSSVIYRLTQKLEAEGYSVETAGKFPKSLKDYQCVLTKNNQRIFIHSYADTESLEEFSSFYNDNKNVDLVVVALEETGTKRSQLFDILSITETDEDVIEIPLSRTIGRDDDNQAVENYLEKMQRLTSALIAGWLT